MPSSKKQGDEAQKSVDIKIQTVEKAIKDIKALQVSDEDAKALQAQSVALFEKVLPIYKNEYAAYAKLCDTKGPDAEKKALLQKISTTYMPEVDRAFEQYILWGKRMPKSIISM